MSGLFDFLKTLFSPKGNKDTSVVVKNYINGNNNSNNNSHNKTSNNNRSTKYSKSKKVNTNYSNPTISNISVKSIRLYTTGSKGKVYTSKFYKSINHNFGIEVVLVNNSSKAQVVNLGHCIYDNNGNNIMKGNFHPRISAHSQFTQNIYVKPQDFSRLKKGKYKSQFWINEKRVQKAFFTIENK